MLLSNLQRKAQNLVTDLEMLRDGEWEPDEDSTQASIDAACEIKDAFPIIMDMADMLCDIKEWLETGKVDGVSMDSEMILSALNELNDRCSE